MLQQGRRSGGGGGPALTAIAAHFKPAHHDVEAAIALNLPLQAVEEIALEFRNLAAAQARHMDVIALGPALVLSLIHI